MKRMDRKEFYERAKKYGHDPKNNKKMDVIGRSRFKDEIIEYLNSDQGKSDTEHAPLWLREKSVEEIADLLMQEVD